MTYRATQTINAGPGVIAYNVGDIVPDDAVANLNAKDKVAKETAPRAPKDPAPKP